MKKKIKFKFNGGNPVIVCSICNSIIKYAKDFTEDEKKALKGELKMKPQFCDRCEEKMY